MHCTLIMCKVDDTYTKVDDKSEYAQNVYLAIFQFDFECTWWEKDAPVIFANPVFPTSSLIHQILTDFWLYWLTLQKYWNN